MSKLNQIALDFGQEPQAPPPEPAPAPAVNDGGEEAPVRQYMAAGGVGVRIKSYKQTPAVQTGDLFGEPPTTEPAPEQTTAPAVTQAVVASVEEPETIAPGLAAIAEAPVSSQREPAATPTAEEPTAMAVEEPASALEERTVVALEEPAASPQPAPTPKRAPAAKRAAVKQGPSKRGRKSLKQVSAEADLIEIPEDEVLFSKQYYTMGEVSEMFRVNQSLLRFWETEFDILQPRKNKKGDRYFRPIDIKHLHLIYHLLRQKKYTIEGAKDFLKKNKKAEERFEVIQNLQQIKAFLQEMKAQL
jgi:DNA-binding transcriptional MerR regulator